MHSQSARPNESDRPRSATVVINNYNYARFLRDSIDSALTQTHPTEVIVVDDGSTDGSREVIASYGPRIRAVLKSNGGQGSAMNAGFALATGDVVFFVDADDMLHEHAVASVLAAWRENTVMAQFQLDVIDTDGRRQGIYPPPWRKLADGDVRGQLLETGSFSTTVTTGLAFRRRELARVMPMPEPSFRYAADGYLVRAAALLGPVQALEEPLAKYRRHGKNDSGLATHADNPAQFFRKKLFYRENEYQAVRSLAPNFGLRASEDLGERDVEYLEWRLFSLALDPASHPVAEDEHMPLLLRYLASRYAQTDPRITRLIDVATAVGVTLLPADAGATLVRWRQVRDSRPRWLQRLAHSYQDARALLRPDTSTRAGSR